MYIGYIPCAFIYKDGEHVHEFKVEFYRRKNGTCPVIEFLESLDNKMLTKVLRMIELLEKNGNELREPYTAHVKDGIFELRTIQGNNITRILYFFVVGKQIVLTNGFIKKTQKTPKKEIELALKYRDDYKSGK